MRTASRLLLPGSLSLVLTAGCNDPAPLDPVLQAAAAPATNLTATAIAHDRIDLVWLGNGSNANTWEVHRSTTGPAGAFALYQVLPSYVSSTTDVGLTEATEYCYRIRSSRRTGRRTTYSEFSNVACATTPAGPLPPPGTLPPTPTNLTAQPHCCHAIGLRWTDASQLETGFRVERATTSSGPWDLVGTPTFPSFSDDDIELEQTFCYQVIAFNGVGESGPSSIVCSAVPAAPTDLAAEVSGRDVNLTWTDNSSVEDGYHVQRYNQTSTSIVATLPSNTTAYRDVSPPDALYEYRVWAKRDNGGSGFSNMVQIMVASSPPAAPSGLSTRPETSTSVVLAWVDGSSTEGGFRLQRSTNGGATWAVVGQTSINSSLFVDVGLSPEVQVCHRVIAFNNAGESAPSNTDCTAPPAAPTELTATGIDEQTINLAWRDNSSVEDGYELQEQYCYYYYSYNIYCYWSLIATFPPNITSHQLRNPGVYSFSYAVVARKDGGQSTWSNEAIPTPPPSGSAAGARRP